jgi:hypothetical protein
MNTKPLLILLVVAGISSCSTAYKVGQTPDDVYYSPAPVQNEYVTVTNENDRDTYSSSAEDREIRRRINNRRLRTYDDYDYGYNYPNSYPYVYNYPYYGYYSYPYGYNYYNFYSPYSYYPPVYFYSKSGKSTYTAPRRYNLGTYIPPATLNNSNMKLGSPNAGARNIAPVRTFTKPPANSGTGVGNFVRKLFTPSNNSGSSNNSNNSTQSRSFEPSRSNNSSSNSSGSSGSSSSGGNAPVRSFHR